MGRWVWSVHSSEECAGLRQVLHCTACLKRVSSSARRAHCSDDIDMLCAFSSCKFDGFPREVDNRKGCSQRYPESGKK